MSDSKNSCWPWQVEWLSLRRANVRSLKARRRLSERPHLPVPGRNPSSGRRLEYAQGAGPS
eukprot:4041430-Alexandrium_andersonii.AAC.1